MTKEKLLKLLAEYNPGVLRTLGFRNGRSDELRNIANIVNEFPVGNVSENDLLKLISALNNYTATTDNRETGRIFKLINEEIAKEFVERAIQQENVRRACELIRARLGNGLEQTHSEYLYQLWRNSYYYERPHQLHLMLQELFGINLGRNSNHIVNSLAVILSIAIYEAILSDPSSPLSVYFSGKIIQSVVSLTHLDEIYLSYINEYLHDYLHYLPSLQWWLGLGLNLGLDYLKGSGAQLVSLYLGGTAFVSLCNKIREKITPPAWYANYLQKYPITMSCLNQYLSDATFGMGAYLGKSFYSGLSYFYNTQQNSSQSKKDNKQESKQGSQQKNKEQNSYSSDQRQKSYDNKQSNKYEYTDGKSSKPSGSSFDEKTCAKFLPIQLNDSEKQLFSKEISCKAQKDECLKTIYKVARLDPQREHNKKEIKRSLNRLSLFWHPDKYPEECINAKNQPAEQMGYINSAREMLNGL